MKSLDIKLVRDLRHLRGQAIATALVVACGVASFVAMRSTYDSLVASRDEYYSLYRFADIFAGLKRAPEPLTASIKNIPGVTAVESRIVEQVTIDLPGMSEPAQGKLISLPDTHAGILNDLYILRGRTLERNKLDQAIISGAFADANGLQPGDTINAVLNGRWRQLQIVGVALSPEFIYEIRPGDIFPDNRRFGIIWMNRRSVEAAFQMQDAFNDVSLTLGPDANESDVIEKLDRLLERYGGTGAYGRTDQISHRFITNELGELEVFGTLIPVIFLGVTAFLLHLVLSRLVNTEREQIGLLKAFGYTNWDVGFHYLKLACAAILGGIIFGLLLGAWLGSGMNSLYGEFFRFPVMEFSVSPAIILWAFIVSLGAAALGAFAAVLRAVALPPAEAMRPEAPASFGEGIVERLGLQRLLSTEWRIVARNVTRQPIKSFLSAFGISLSVVLLFIGFYFFDAVTRIVQVQFTAVQREDVNVTFYEPRSAAVVYDLGNMPGVTLVEPYRMVAARLRFENRSRRVGLEGLQPDPELHRVVDKDLRVMPPPAEGILLGRSLADSLGVTKDDILTVEVTESTRPVKQLKIAGVVDEVVGLGAYMDIRALNRMMNDGNPISGAFLAVESDRRDALYQFLKTTPAVAGVGLPGAALQSFNDTIARTIGTSTTFLIGFACVIAFGVVYNGARIALAERGRELASLRVLGFTRREIVVMLLGEQALLTAFAIPMGWAIGYFVCWLITKVIDVEIVRLPMVLSLRTFLFSALIVAAAAVLSGLLVAARVKNMDLIEVLKTRE